VLQEPSKVTQAQYTLNKAPTDTSYLLRKPSKVAQTQHTPHKAHMHTSETLPPPIIKPVTPVNPVRLQHHLQRIGYDPEKTKFLVEGFTYGFRLQHTGQLSSATPNNDSSVLEFPLQMQEKLQKELDLGRMKGPFDEPPFEHFHISPLKLREKGVTGKYRLLHNLSWPYDGISSVNTGIDQDSKSVKYSSVTIAIALIMAYPRGSLTSKSDLQDAFKIVPIHPDDHHKLGIKYNGKYYYDITLPMGCASACQIFEAISTALHAIHVFDTEQGTLHYLDDFFFIDTDLLKAQDNKMAFDTLCNDVGIPQAPHKITQPAFVTEFLGIELDSENWVARLPLAKVIAYLAHIKDLLLKNRVTQRELQSIIGKLSFCTLVVPARPFLRRLISRIHTVKKQHHHIAVTAQMKQDLRIWIHFLNHYNGITYFRAFNIVTGQHFNMGADAAKTGYGATFGTHWVQERFPQTWLHLFDDKLLGISFLEFFPIYVLISLYGHQVQDSTVTFHSDNQGVVDIINSQTSSSNNIMLFLRPLVLLLMQYNISLRSKHIPGYKNVLCDKISRYQVTQSLLDQYGLQHQKDTIPQHLMTQAFVDLKKEIHLPELDGVNFNDK